MPTTNIYTLSLHDALPILHQPRLGQQAGRREILGEHQAQIEHRTQRGDEQAAPAELDGAAGDDRQHVERREVTGDRSEEHTSELQSLTNIVCRLMLEKKKQ